MEWNEISANWPALSGSIMTRWPDAEEDRVLAIDGDREALIAYVSRLDAVPVVEAADRVSEWAETAMPADAQMDPVRDDAAISESAAELAPGEEPLHDDAGFGDEDSAGRTAPEPPIGRTP